MVVLYAFISLAAVWFIVLAFSVYFSKNMN